MITYITYNVLIGASYNMSIANSVLTISRNGSNNQTFDLQGVINNYSTDHGCIVLADHNNSNNVQEYVWIETTHLTSLYRTPYGKSYSSLNSANNSIKTDNTSAGQYNYASPSWAVTQINEKYRPIFFILTPSENCNLNDCVVIYRDATEGTNHTSMTIDGTALTNSNVATLQSVKTFLNEWNPISFATVNSTAFVVTANTTGNIYLNSTAGVLNRTVAKSGQTVVINTSGLTPGENITVKAGYRYYPNISNTILTV
jgi:hypothetical protein